MEIQGYAVRVQGQISESMKAWWEGVRIEAPDGMNSVLYLPSPDQASLFGVLLRIRDLGIRLISVTPIEEARRD